ncbi:PadR family transcriptional regulator [Christensenellaceae bacterium OttesenSCG-928-K19]|nr:PadR family transcriptional regulator [Christensenellaceae bacterium OttesenSCG-928-K19]
MISKINIILLGIINENPMNPYEMTKYIQDLELRSWLPISDSSIYTAVKTMNQRELITGETMRAGNMPEKTVYSITPHGKRQFINALESILVSTHIDYISMTIVLLFIHCLQEKRCRELLEKRLHILRSERTRVENQKNRIKRSDMGLSMLTAQERIIKLLELEIDTTLDLIYYISTPEFSKKLMNENLSSIYTELAKHNSPR